MKKILRVITLIFLFVCVFTVSASALMSISEYKARKNSTNNAYDSELNIYNDITKNEFFSTYKSSANDSHKDNSKNDDEQERVISKFSELNIASIIIDVFLVIGLVYFLYLVLENKADTLKHSVLTIVIVGFIGIAVYYFANALYAEKSFIQFIIDTLYMLLKVFVYLFGTIYFIGAIGAMIRKIIRRFKK